MSRQPGKSKRFAFLQNTTLLQKGLIIVAALALIGGVAAAAIYLPEWGVATGGKTVSEVASSGLEDQTSSTPTSSVPASSVPTSSAVVSSKPVSSAPASSEVTSSKPVSSTPASSAPVSSAPAASKPPVSSAPVSSAPVASKPPVSSAPVSSAPVVSKPPVASTPVPVGGLPSGYLPSFATAYSQNKEVVGRLTLSGTKLDYYVAKTKDNVYYLNRTFTKAKSGWGNPYMDYRCTVSQNGNSHNMILYGHSNDKNGTQLSALKGYRKIDFYRQHPTIKFDTVYGEGTYKVLAFFIENTKPGTSFFKYHMFINQTDPSYINQFMDNAKLRSYINTTVDWNVNDQFLTISTCEDTNVSNYNRLVLVARKVRPGESTAVDTSGATQNAKQLLPKK